MAIDPGCECTPVPEEYWTTHYGIADPTTQIEWSPDCPVHGDTAEQVLRALVRLKDGPRDYMYRETKEHWWDRARRLLARLDKG